MAYLEALKIMMTLDLCDLGIERSALRPIK